MARIAGNQSTERFKLDRDGDGGCATITDKATGRVLPLKGYGALEGEFQVRSGLDLTKPIAAQVDIRETRKRSAVKAP